MKNNAAPKISAAAILAFSCFFPLAAPTVQPKRCFRWGRCACARPKCADRRFYSFTVRSRSEFVTTEMDDALIAKAANIGLMRIPRKGKRIPAATGTPAAL